jgi:hypothetical protein
MIQSDIQVGLRVKTKQRESHRLKSKTAKNKILQLSFFQADDLVYLVTVNLREIGMEPESFVWFT